MYTTKNHKQSQKTIDKLEENIRKIYHKVLISVIQREHLKLKDKKII